MGIALPAWEPPQENQSPVVASPLADATATEGSLFTCTISASAFSDPDGDTLTYSASALPSWLVFDPESLTFSGTPGNDDVGSLTPRVTVTDPSGKSVSQSFVLTVANINDAPVLNAPLTDQTATEDQLFSFRIPTDTFTDIDAGDQLVFTSTLADGSLLPSWLTFDSITRTFSGTPVNEDVGILNIQTTATDLAGEKVNSSFTLNVANVNDAPILNSDLPTLRMFVDGSFIYTVPGDTITDPDSGDILNYSATQADGSALPSWLSFDAATHTFSGSPASPETVSVRLGAMDTGNQDASTVFDIVVSPQNLQHLGTSYVATLNGGTGNDILHGLAGVDVLVGNAGDDIFFGYAGNDRLNGGAGVDTLIGGLGKDTLTGGADSDFFVFDTALSSASNVDSITDFAAGQDKIQLDKKIFTALKDEGMLSSAFFRASANGAAMDENDYFLYNTTSGRLFYDADGNGQGVAVQFATLTSKPVVSANDFMIAS